MLFFQLEAKGAISGAAPLKAVKRGAQSTPGSARPKSAPPLSREEGEPRRDREGQEMEMPRPQGPEETVLAPGAMPPPRDADLGGAVRQAQVEEGRAIVASNATSLCGPQGKGPAGPEAPTAGGEGDARWGKSPVFWPNLNDAEGGARFVLDDPSDSYLWQGLDACGASVEAINRASELVSRDMYNLVQVRPPSMS